jgi:hypothetical protein
VEKVIRPDRLRRFLHLAGGVHHMIFLWSRFSVVVKIDWLYQRISLWWSKSGWFKNCSYEQSGFSNQTNWRRFIKKFCWMLQFRQIKFRIYWE